MVSFKHTDTSKLREFQGAVDKRDQDTPDDWVKRHPDLIRLTGRHPFNSEPSPSDLMESAIEFDGLTPTSLHYVRNHAAVPELKWETHKLVINGLLNGDIQLTMDQLVALPSTSFAVTLSCAGNRRKEQNMVKKSQGFNWGQCAVSTSVYTGVLLSDILALGGGAKWINFDGADKLPQGSYGTSLNVNYALDKSNDVMIAYMMNGYKLSEDHGFPLRVIIPGFIGGRMVKWLSNITCSENESESFYHYQDNRVLPPNISTKEEAVTGGWWKMPQYIINNRNINSALLLPVHEEVFSILTLTQSRLISFQGYAYSGSGLEISRVEYTLDDGVTWTQIQDVRYGSPEPPRHGYKYWCWFLFNFSIPTSDLKAVQEVTIRAWDESCNTQPEHITWNLLGQMHNPWYRLRVTHTGDNISFSHPIDMVTDKGWMVPSKESNKTAATEGGNLFTAMEVAQHTTENDCWIIVDDKVYDVTEFINRHPGGKKSILLVAGQDCTADFNSIHSQGAHGMKEKYLIGYITSTNTTLPPQMPPTRSNALQKGSLSSRITHPFDDSTTRIKVVVVGLGMVGLNFVERLLKADEKVGRYEICIFGEEPHVAYNVSFILEN
ncbi:Oxidoreductase, molybdopterin-binding domain-containing protein [Globomyces pollinis-pini]|nr:Oxidoreductase, molybdopterin-binding domain-containing protein [Globomyces pollinis-pini]